MISPVRFPFNPRTTVMSHKRVFAGPSPRKEFSGEGFQFRVGTSG